MANRIKTRNSKRRPALPLAPPTRRKGQPPPSTTRRRGRGGRARAGHPGPPAGVLPRSALRRDRCSRCRAAVAVCAPARPLLAVRPRLTAAPARPVSPHRASVSEARARDARHARARVACARTPPGRPCAPRAARARRRPSASRLSLSPSALPAFKPRRLRASASTVVPIVPCSAVRRPKRTSDRAARAMKRRLDGGRPALRTGGRPARGRAVQLAAPPAGCACAPCCRRSVAAGAPGERRPLVCCHVAAPRRRLSDAARLHQPAAPQLEQAQRRRQCCDACGRAAGSSRSRRATRSTLPPPIASGGAQRAVRAAGGGGLRVRFFAEPEHVWALSRGVAEVLRMFLG
jgi:hypothetical protein